MAVHAPLMRDLACQDALWTRAVAADSPTPEEAASHNAQTQGMGQEHFVQEFSSESPARLQSQQDALDALSAERARQYKLLCDQVGAQQLSHLGSCLTLPSCAVMAVATEYASVSRLYAMLFGLVSCLYGLLASHTSDEVLVKASLPTQLLACVWFFWLLLSLFVMTHVPCRIVPFAAVQLKQQSKDDSKQGALMHVTVKGAQARLIVLPTDETTTQGALDFIARVDPPSQGVPMRQVHIAASAKPLNGC